MRSQSVPSRGSGWVVGFSIADFPAAFIKDRQAKLENASTHPLLRGDGTDWVIVKSVTASLINV